METGQGGNMEGSERYAEKIAKLLAKAESTTPEEAELLIGKAQQLMTEYAISEAMIDAARGVSVDEIEQCRFAYGGFLRKDLGEIAWAVLRANDCKGVYSTMGTTIDGKY